MNRPRAFQPVCSQLERRSLLSGWSQAGMTTLAVTEAPAAKSTALKLIGISPYGFLAHLGEPVGSPISYIGLGGRSQKLTANGVKVPNSASNRVVPAEGTVVARLGAKYVQFYAPATLSLSTSKGTLTLALNPVSPGSNVVSYVVTAGTGVFAKVHGTGTITFAIVATFHSNK